MLHLHRSEVSKITKQAEFVKRYWHSAEILEEIFKSEADVNVYTDLGLHKSG